MGMNILLQMLGLGLGMIGQLLLLKSPQKVVTNVVGWITTNLDYEVDEEFWGLGIKLTFFGFLFQLAGIFVNF
jgi:hypothetical protein